jgi:hypothetical protein
MNTTMSNTEAPAYIDYPTAERIYGMPRHQILRLAKAGRLTLYRPLGRKALIRAADLESLIVASADGQRGTATD